MNLNELFIEPELKVTKRKNSPPSYLRKTFQIGKELNEAKLTITACGVYIGSVNGKKITDQVLMPGCTFYTKRLQFQTYDITSLLRKGKNVLGVILGDGWYRGSIGYHSTRNVYGKKIKVAALLSLNFTDGTQKKIITDRSWKATQKGPILKSDWKEGEIYDARKEIPGWNTPNYDDRDWHSVYPSSYDGLLVASEGEKILEHERFTAEIIITPDGSTVLNFTQNIFGYVEFQVTGKKGQKVKLVHGEILDQKGNFTVEHLLTKKDFPFQEIEYILKDGHQTFKPYFVAQGFQYVKLENWPEPVRPENFISIAVYSDLKQTGTFKCSNPLVNRLFSNALWSQKGNFVDIPTDCPQRERAGWTGDIASYCRAASYLMNTDKFLAKWLKDLAIQQGKNGIVPDIVPKVDKSEVMWGAAGWADAAVVVPYWQYQFYGNIKILEDQYECMVKWMNFLEKRATKTHPSQWFKRNPYKTFTINAGFHFGEWGEPGMTKRQKTFEPIYMPDYEVATACFGYSAKLMAEIASVLGKPDDEKKYATLFDNIKMGYRYNYTKDGLISSNRQCKYVLPIAYDILPEKDKKKNISILNEMVVQNNYRIGTGFLTTPWILQTLSDFGYEDTAYKMLENTELPGWLYQVKKGATTIWERWDAIDHKGGVKGSFNHYLMGSFTAWLFSHVAGIRSLEPGFSKILIKPLPGGSFTSVSCAYESVSGPITSSWKIDEKSFHLSVEVPTDTEVHLPDGTIHQVTQGKHAFSIKLHKG